jgi:hypothetical protein
MTRKAHTLIETLVAAVLGLSVFFMAFALFRATRTMSTAGDLSSAMAQATLAMEHLHRDLIRAVPSPDQKSHDIIHVFPKTNRFAFIRADIDPQGTLVGQLVVYEREKTPGGHFRLVRQAGGKKAALPGTYSRVDLATLDDSGGPFVRVTLHVVTHDAATDPARGSEETVITTLMRVATPEMLRSGMLKFRFLKGLAGVEVPKDL